MYLITYRIKQKHVSKDTEFDYGQFKDYDDAIKAVDRVWREGTSKHDAKIITCVSIRIPRS